MEEAGWISDDGQVMLIANSDALTDLDGACILSARGVELTVAGHRGGLQRSTGAGEWLERRYFVVGC